MATRNELLRDILSAIGGGGSVQWGSIGGNILDQTDLQAQIESITATNVEVINSEADFATQDATTITLSSGTYYQLGASFSTTKRFICNDAILVGLNIATILTYTGTGSMFTNTNSQFTLRDMGIDCPNGTVFESIGDDSGNPNHRVNAESLVVFNCDKVMTSTDSGAHVFDLVQIINMSGTHGLTFSGSTPAIVYSFERISFNGLMAGSIVYDFGSSVSLEIEMSNNVFLGDPLAIAISGLSSSGNITAGNLGMVSNCNMSSYTNPLSGISPNDVRWDFQSNAGVGDSISDALIHTESNLLETVITTQSVRVKVNAVFLVDVLGRFTSDGTGRLTYIGEKTVRLPIDVSATIKSASGGDKQLDLCIAINGVVVAPTCVQGTASANKSTVLPTLWQHDFVQGDYVEIFTADNSGTTNIIVTQAILRIN